MGISGKKDAGDGEGVRYVGKLGVIEARDEEVGCCIFCLHWVRVCFTKVDG